MIRIADYVIQRLVDEGIKHIFLITGRGILYLTDAVAKNKDITGISTYHEQGASYAAMAYATAKDGCAACLVSTGCAATNAVTAALCSFQDNLPVIFISGQHMLNETTRYNNASIRTYGSQEADIISVIESITKYSTMLTKPSEVGYEMDRLIYSAQKGRKGPVWIDIPLDVQNARIDETALKRFSPEEVALNSDSKREIADVVAELSEAIRPVIFIGGGVRSGEAINELECFVSENRIPVVFSTAAADAYGSGNELSIGAVGSLGGSRAGNFTVQNADYIIAIGTKLCSQSVGDFDNFAREAKITVVDIDENEHKKKGTHIDRVINIDAKEFLQNLCECKISLKCDKWVEKCLHWKEIFAVSNEQFVKELTADGFIDLYLFNDMLSEVLPGDATVITDAGLEELTVPSTIRYRSGQRCLFPAAQGAMGYAIPAIIGAHYAEKSNIIVVVGDGSFMMNMQELLLIGSKQIPAKIFIINNNMYSVIRKRQKDLFRTRTIGNDPSDGVPAPDFNKIANSFDIAYTKIESNSQLKQRLEAVISYEGPMICEVMCVEEQKYLHMSYAFNEKRKLIKRPLEDLSPFIDRELFKSEMVIEPIEE